MKYILAHDLGTSGNKATLFSDEGKMITSEVFRYDCHYFNTNWAEQDPEDFWKAICVTSRNLIDKARIDPGLYSPTGTMQAGGSSYNWLKGQVAKYETAVAKVQGISPYDLINAEAAKSPVGANGVLFLPYLLGERAPRWNPDATAAWLGLKMENQRCDLFRAVLEGVTLNLNIILESFRRSIPIDELLVVGGGAKGALWCQMMADVYNARIKVPVLLEEATSMGAAVTGGVGVGVFKGFEVIDQMLELNRTVEPDPEAVAAYGPVKEAFEVCYKAMLPVYEYMASHKNA